MYPKQNFQQWRADWQLYKDQFSFAQEQCEKYKHLIETQAIPGNLPTALAKWQDLRARCLKALKLHIARAGRWQLELEQSLLPYLEQLQELEKQTSEGV
jgi:hypothetical protein